MKKLLSLLLSVTMLLGTFVLTSSATGNTCVRISDTSGSTGYSAGSETVNNYVVENDGATLIFDVYVESYTNPTSGLFSQILAFSGDSDMNFSGYNFGLGAFTIGSGTAWPTQSQSSTYTALSTRDFSLEKGVWYELAFQFDGNEVIVYVDGTPMVAAEVDSVDNKYLIVYPQFCTILMDNIRVCDKNYNVRNRVGEVFASEDFTGVTSVSGSSVWGFDTSYTISQNGRPATDITDMTPNRVVEPSIDGAYLQYKESGGSGIAVSCADFTDYSGFTFVEDIRVDRKSTGANFAVRFGSQYIAGYDWDSQCFRISQRAGYGFNTAAAYTYATAEYALSLGTTYEFAVKQEGSIVSVYINGVLVTQATNDGFVAGFNSIDVSHYRVGAAIDNIIIAYPDYDVKEATGGTVATLSFDESAEYINSVWNFNIGTSGYGYSIVKSASGSMISADSVEVEAGVTSATVGLSLSGSPAFDSFVMNVEYNSELSISKATAATIDGAVTSVSSLSKKPLVMSCAIDHTFTGDTELMSITFGVPTAAGEYEYTATITLYNGGAEVATCAITAVITVPVTEVEVQVGIPSGVDYDGEYICWDYVDGAEYYGIYSTVPFDDSYEEWIDDTYDCEYEFVFTDYFSDPGMYMVKVYAYNENGDIFGVSDPFVVIYNDDDTISLGLQGYADQLYSELAALVESRNYSDDDRSYAEDLLAEAESEMQYAADCNDYDALVDTYDIYYAEIDSIPEKEEIVIAYGLPDGIEYDGTTLSWNSFAGAASYRVYLVNISGDTLMQSSATNSLEFSIAGSVPSAGRYQFRIDAFDADGNTIAMSELFAIVLGEDGKEYFGLSEYAAALYEDLAELVSSKLYTAENKALADEYLASANTALNSAESYDDLISVYKQYYSNISDIPEREVAYGEPDGITYDGLVMSWNEVADAAMYEIYCTDESGANTHLGTVYACEFEFTLADNYTEAGGYEFKILAYNENERLLAESDPYTVALEADGTVYFGLDAYRNALYGKLEALVSGRKYTDENQAVVDGILAEAKTALEGESGYNALLEQYDNYYAQLDAVEQASSFIVGDVNGDGIVSTSDVSQLSRALAGAAVDLAEGADVNGDGVITLLDLSSLKRIVSG